MFKIWSWIKFVEYLFRDYKKGSRLGSGFWRIMRDLWDEVEWAVIDIIWWLQDTFPNIFG